MAYTVTQTPTHWIAGSLTPIIYVVYDDTNNGSPKFKYVCDLYIGGVKVHREKILPNENGRGVFRIDRFVDDYLYPTLTDQNQTDGTPISGVGVGTATPYSKNLDSIRQIEVRFGSEVAADADSNPVLTADQITGNTLVVVKAHRYVQPSSQPLLSYTYPGDEMMDDLETSASTRFFISNAPVVQKAPTILARTERIDQDIERGQAHVISFLNDLTNSPSSSAVSFIHIGAYTSAGGTVFTQSIQNTSGNGGEPPTSANSDDERLIYFGSGWVNLETQTANATIAVGMTLDSVAYYEVVAASSATLNTSTQRSHVYRFNRTEECEYPTRRLMFLNQWGGWDFYNFTRRNVLSADMERKTYYGESGNWATATDNFAYNYTDRGKTTMKTDVKWKETLQTDWVGEEWNTFFTALYASREVYLIEQAIDQLSFPTDALLVPVTITNTSMDWKTSANDKLFSHTVNIEMGNAPGFG